MARKIKKPILSFATGDKIHPLVGTPKAARSTKLDQATGKDAVWPPAFFDQTEDATGKTHAPEVEITDRPAVLGESYRQPDIAYTGLAVVEPSEAWGGDPRKMRAEDLAFFEIKR